MPVVGDWRRTGRRALWATPFSPPFTPQRLANPSHNLHTRALLNPRFPPSGASDASVPTATKNRQRTQHRVDERDNNLHANKWTHRDGDGAEIDRVGDRELFVFCQDSSLESTLVDEGRLEPEANTHTCTTKLKKNNSPLTHTYTTTTVTLEEIQGEVKNKNTNTRSNSQKGAQDSARARRTDPVKEQGTQSRWFAVQSYTL